MKTLQKPLDFKMRGLKVIRYFYIAMIHMCLQQSNFIARNK